MPSSPATPAVTIGRKGAPAAPVWCPARNIGPVYVVGWDMLLCCCPVVVPWATVMGWQAVPSKRLIVWRQCRVDLGNGRVVVMDGTASVLFGEPV